MEDSNLDPNIKFQPGKEFLNLFFACVLILLIPMIWFIKINLKEGEKGFAFLRNDVIAILIIILLLLIGAYKWYQYIRMFSKRNYEVSTKLNWVNIFWLLFLIAFVSSVFDILGVQYPYRRLVSFSFPITLLLAMKYHEEIVQIKYADWAKYNKKNAI
jgi:predicted MFS family arabinose efflux permease